jgi:ATP-dependent protease ClpP protease subunit
MSQPKVIRIDGVIGTGADEVSSQMVRDQLPQNGTDPIAVKIHSEGGSVFEGFAMHDALEAYKGPKTLAIESSAFSIASFVAMAFDDVEISSNGYMMLHNPYAVAEGDDEDFAQQSQLLAKLKASMVSAYAQRSGKSEEEIKAILKDETYLNAQQAVDMGFAKRITGKPVIGREFASVSNMPHGVVSALFGAGSGGEKRDSMKGQKMSESQPVAATLQEIKAAFPKAKAEFVVKCLERSLPMASVASAAVEEMMTENAALRAELEELKAAKSKAELPTEEPETETETETEARSEEETVPAEKAAVKAIAKAKPKASGAPAIAKAKTGGPSARARWNAAVETCLPKCRGDKFKAVKMANKLNPGLREAYVEEVNA